MNILHVSSHYGGGVGTVINALKSNDTSNTHRFTHLNPGNKGQLFDSSLVDTRDVVVRHVWNHPAMFEFLVNVKLPPRRLVIWSHVSGLYAPYIHFQKMIQYSDVFVFTSPISYDGKQIINIPENLKSKLKTIWSTYGVQNFINVKKQPHDGFNVGIIGTVDYGKLHGDFIQMCASVNVPNIKFIVCSTDSQEHLKQAAAKMNVIDRFSFCGRVDDIKMQLSKCDVFGYPLQPTHFGSCQQALGQAMMCGLVPIVLNNPAQRHIVQHMRTGIIANNEIEYVKAIQYLYNNKDILRQLSDNAKIQAIKKYDIKNTVRKWNQLFVDIIKIEKKQHSWSNEFMPPYMVYAISMGNYGKPFVDYVFADQIGDREQLKTSQMAIKLLYKTNSMFRSTRKGSIKQYIKYYPNDKYLQRWENFLE